jgi:6-phosphofructokinase
LQAARYNSYLPLLYIFRASLYYCPMSKPRVGILNSGGDCPGLNTVIDAIVKSLDQDYDIYGFYRGFEGLMTNQYTVLNRIYTSEHRWIGGTILKSVNKGHFGGRIDPHHITAEQEAAIKQSFENYTALGLEGLIILGGDGTLSIAYNLEKYGFKIVGVPKSIDNDLEATDFTFGFQTAVEIACEALDRLHTTAASHDRMMILEVMGRTSGWIALYSGIAGGANIILLPEIPFTYERIAAFLDQRQANGRTSSVIVIAEGARVVGGHAITKHTGDHHASAPLGGVGHHLEQFINEHTPYEARCTSLGHIQRGGSPSGFDRVLSMQMGAAAANLLRAQNFGKMVAYKHNQIVEVDINESISHLKLVNPQSQIVQLARQTGVHFGD